MDVNNIMSTYNLNSLWNTFNSISSNSSVPLINNLDSAVQDNYAASNYFGQNTATDLQDIYQQVEPVYGMPLTYNSAGDLSIPTNITPSSNGLSPVESNIVSLLNSGNTTAENTTENILSQYDAIENGTYQDSLSSILSTSPTSVYNAVDSLVQPANNNLDTFV